MPTAIRPKACHPPAAVAGTTFDVFASDGIKTISSVFILDHYHTPWIDQTEIYVRSSLGNEYYPETSAELAVILKNIQQAGTKIEQLTIKGHGHYEPEQIQVGDGGGTIGNYMTVSLADHIILEYEGEESEDITQLLKDIVEAVSKPAVDWVRASG